MTNVKSTKRALSTSIVALILCFSMLLGTTFAWFTDSVVSENNIIKSGNLDVTLEYYNGTKWVDVKGASDILTGDLWEPGYVDTAYLRIKNAGSLALKYQLGVNIVSEKTGKTSKGETITLSDYIYFDVIEGVDGETSAYKTREEALAVTTEKTLISAGYTKAASLDAGSDYVYLAMVVYMPTWVANEANHNGIDKPEINLGIKITATQMTTESDSFDNYYDSAAGWYGDVDLSWYDPAATELTISTAEQLAGLAAIVNGTAKAPVTTFASTEPETVHDDFAGKTVKLNGDIDLDNLSWTPIGRIGTTSTDFTYAFRGTFDGQSHTISNLNVSNSGWAGLFGIAYSAEIKNVNVSGATIKSNRMAGTIVGQHYGSIYNCHVENAEITVVPNAVGDSYDNGDKVGGIVGWIGDNGNNRVLSDCSATNVTIKAYRDVGGIAGYVASSTLVKNNTATDYNITVDQRINNYGYKDTNAGAIMGRINGTVTDENNVSLGDNSIIREYYIKNGVIITAGSNSEDVYLSGIPADYSESTLEIPEGVTALGNKILNGNTVIKEVIVPSSVQKFGGTPNAAGTGASGGFFYGSAVEKVTLPEGITEIPAAMFNQATKLNEVNIPSSVTKIGINAFAGSGLSTLTVPSTVTEIGYGAFRDMANLTTVTIECDNVDIPVYAFRACANLETVIIKGENVTFGGGSRGMIFTNKSNGDGSAITVYVANETVKDRLLAADTASKDYGGYTLAIINEIPEDKELSDVLTDGADTVYVPSDNYTEFPADKISEGDTIICAPGTVFEGTSSLNVNGATVVGATFSNKDGQAISGTVNGTFKDCVFEGAEALRWCYTNEGETVVFENCVIKTDFRGFHFDTMNGNVIFKNCEINGFNAYGGNGTVTFEGCTFGYDESYYSGLNIYSDTVLKDCTFNFLSGKSSFVDMEGTGKTLTITNCTVTLDGEKVSPLDFVGGSKLADNTVIFDGAVVVSTSEELNAAVKTDASIYLMPGEYELTNTAIGATLKGADEETVKVNATVPIYGFTGKFPVRMHFENLTFTNTISTFQDTAKAEDGGVSCTFTNVTFGAGFRHGYGSRVAFTDCTFGSNSEGYALHFEYDEGGEELEVKITNCVFEGGKVHLGGPRTYAFTNCDFASGTDFQVWTNITLEGCTVDGVAVTADNVATFFPNLDASCVTIK